MTKKNKTPNWTDLEVSANTPNQRYILNAIAAGLQIATEIVHFGDGADGEQQVGFNYVRDHHASLMPMRNLPLMAGFMLAEDLDSAKDNTPAAWPGDLFIKTGRTTAISLSRSSTSGFVKVQMPPKISVIPVSLTITSAEPDPLDPDHMNVVEVDIQNNTQTGGKSAFEIAAGKKVKAKPAKQKPLLKKKEQSTLDRLQKKAQKKARKVVAKLTPRRVG